MKLSEFVKTLSNLIILNILSNLITQNIPITQN